MSNVKQLPLYQCHKRVRAAKIQKIVRQEVPLAGIVIEIVSDDGVIGVSLEWAHKHQPHPGGYFVAYEDGYTSYSPAEAFESGYTRLPDVDPALAPHQQRVVAEKAELDEKIAKLDAFISTFDKPFSVFANLAEPERQRLYAQHRAMVTYSTILAERIAAFVR